MQKKSILVSDTELMFEWHVTRNTIEPSEISVGSGKKVWWQCAEGHEWETTPKARTAGRGCFVCSNRILYEGFNDLATVNPKLAAEWHPTKNENLLPSQVFPSQAKKVWWLCKNNHEWQVTINSRSRGTGCPYCAGRKVIQGVNDFATKFPTLAAEWHPTKNAFRADQITFGSGKKVWWYRKECGHEWEASITNRSLRGDNCPFCSGQKLLPAFNDLVTKFPILALEWHPSKNGELKPSDVQSGTHLKIWWQCLKGHEWQAAVSDRIHYVTKCPLCAHPISQGEQSLFDWLENFNLNIIQSDRSVLEGKEIDILFSDQKLGIEYNGLYWHTEAAGKEENYHHDKWLLAKNKGVQLIQVWEDDWLNRPEIVKSMLKHKLKISDNRKVYARKTEICVIDSKKAKEFLSFNHLQGYASGSYYLGLKDKNSDLIAVMVLKWQENKALEIVRYATSINVVGGFSKLVSNAEAQYKPSSFLTFSDNCVSDGSLYQNNGFSFDKNLKPDYSYFVNNERKHKFGYRLKRFKNDSNLKWESGLSERELAQLNGMTRIWDAGKIRWVKLLSPTEP